jgi:hypothetical protein
MKQAAKATLGLLVLMLSVPIAMLIGLKLLAERMHHDSGTKRIR